MVPRPAGCLSLRERGIIFRPASFFFGDRVSTIVSDQRRFKPEIEQVVPTDRTETETTSPPIYSFNGFIKIEGSSVSPPCAVAFSPDDPLSFSTKLLSYDGERNRKLLL